MKEACFTKALTVAFSPETYLKIKEITDREKISMGEWVRKAAEKALSDQENDELSTETKAADSPKSADSCVFDETRRGLTNG